MIYKYLFKNIKLCYQIHNYLYHDFFIFWITLCNKESNSNQCSVIDFSLMFLIKENLIFCKKQNKDKCCTSLVSIGKWVIFDNKVEEMSCFRFKSRIEFISIIGLVDISKNSFESIYFSQMCEKLCCFMLDHQILLEFNNSSIGLICLKSIKEFSSLPDFWKRFFIIFLKQEPTRRISCNDIKEPHSFSTANISTCYCFFHKTHCLLQLKISFFFLSQSFFIEEIPLYEIVFEYLVCPDTKTRPLDRLHSISYRDDDIEIVQNDRFIWVCNMHFLHIAFFIQFSFGKYISDMTRYHWLISSEKLYHIRLRQPYCILCEVDLHSDLSVFSCVDLDFFLCHSLIYFLYTLYYKENSWNTRRSIILIVNLFL